MYIGLPIAFEKKEEGLKLDTPSADRHAFSIDWLLVTPLFFQLRRLKSQWVENNCFHSSDQQRAETKPIKINSSSNGNNNMLIERITTPKQSGSSFEDVKVDDSDESYNSPPIRKEHSIQLKTSNSTASHYNNKNSNHIPKQHNFNQQMLIESMRDDGDQEEDQLDNNRASRTSNRLSQKLQSNNDSNDVLLLLDAHEHLTVIKFSLLLYFSIILILLLGQ